ncbi:hypothetical protein BDZ89DRAFT_838063 [Hymenopellis radicata]|nr:hypothetical protein BDZ89DRAFT_838063 [Hymenopellis radicata]
MNLCHVWIADVVAIGDKRRTSLGRVWVMILQRSFLTLPDLDDVEHNADGVRVKDHDPLNILAQEYRMFEKLQDLQGYIIPYCLGLYQLKMPNGEVACVLILEHVEGKTLDEWDDESRSPELKLPVSQEEYDCLPFDQGIKMQEDLLEIASLTDPHTNINKSMEEHESNAQWLRYFSDAKIMRISHDNSNAQRQIPIPCKLVYGRDHNRP